MSQVSVILTSIFMVALVLMIAPSVIAMNRGKMLRNIAIWLAVFALVGLAYKHIGPGRVDEPAPAVEQTSTDQPAPPAAEPAPEQDFTPPTD